MAKIDPVKPISRDQYDDVLGNPIKVEIRDAKGVWHEVAGLVSQIEISSGLAYDTYRFYDGAVHAQGVGSGSFTLTGLIGPEGFKAFTPTDRYDEEVEVLTGACCKFCGSGWIEDSRGNCGACGAPKAMAFS